MTNIFHYKIGLKFSMKNMQYIHIYEYTILKLNHGTFEH